MISDLISTNKEFWDNTIKYTSQNYNSPIQSYCTTYENLQNTLINDKKCKASIDSYLSNFVYLKGEYLVAVVHWGFLTNYRLVYNYNHVFSIAILF
jgi:hypothetical protein